MSDEPPGPIMQRVVKFFKEDDWKFHQSEDQTALRLSYRGKNATIPFMATVNESTGIARFYATYDFNVLPDKRQDIAEFITRANYGMQHGNFEMDFSDGELRYKVSIDVEDSTESLTSPVIKRMVYACLLNADRYYPYIMRVVYGGETPEAAIQKIDGR